MLNVIGLKIRFVSQLCDKEALMGCWVFDVDAQAQKTAHDIHDETMRDILGQSWQYSVPLSHGETKHGPLSVHENEDRKRVR